MKKRTLFLSLLLALGIVSCSPIIGNNSNNNQNTNTTNNKVEFTKYDLISDLLNDLYSNKLQNGFTVTGVVSKVFVENGYYNAYVQNGEGDKTAAFCLAKIKVETETAPNLLGARIEVKGKATYKNGIYAVALDQAGNSYTIKDAPGSSTVNIKYLSAEQLTAEKSSEYWTKNILTGPIYTGLNNAYIKDIDDDYASVVIPSADEEITLYYGDSDEANDIYEKIREYEGRFNVTGYLNAFDKAGSENSRILVKSLDDITFITGDFIEVMDLSISVSKISLDIGETAKASAIVYPENATDKSFTWASSDPSVATIDEEGNIVALYVGSTVISATSDTNINAFDAVIIDVYSSQPLPVQEIRLDDENDDFQYINGVPHLYVSEGWSFSIPCVVYPTNVNNSDINYTIVEKDNNFLYDLYDGFYLVTSTGTATIKAASAENPNIYLCIVVESLDISTFAIEEIVVPETEYRINVGETITIPVSLLPSTCKLDMIDIEYFPEAYSGEISVSYDYEGTITVTGVRKGSCQFTIYDYYGITEKREYITFSIKGEETTQSSTETINFTTSVGSYNSNFGSTNKLGTNRTEISYYRASSSGGEWTLYPSCNLTSALKYSLPGSIQNETAKYAIKSLNITYTGAGTINYGVNKDCTNSTVLSASSSKTTQTINTVDAFFYRVEANKGQKLSISSITFNYDTSKRYSSYNTPHLRENTRIPATVYSGELIDGVSYVDVPIDVTVNGDYYTVNKTKRYKYYSYSYAYAHRYELDLNEVALTDPMDVANYYIAFGCAPANYIAKGDVTKIKNNMGSSNNVQSLFGDKARYVSEYSRTNGYAIGIPYYGSPTYLEFDFDGNGKYSLSARDVCRVVVWATGWTGEGYGSNIPVATYTDDHYVTFREFNNCDGWNEPFDSINNGNYTQVRTNYNYGSTKTLIKK